MKTNHGRLTTNRILKQHTCIIPPQVSIHDYNKNTKTQSNPCIFHETKEVQALGCNNGRDVLRLGVISPKYCDDCT
jgi:hypothetical protein